MPSGKLCCRRPKRKPRNSPNTENNFCREVDESCEGGGLVGEDVKSILNTCFFFVVVVFLSTAAFKGIFLLTRSLKKK